MHLVRLRVRVEVGVEVRVGVGVKAGIIRSLEAYSPSRLQSAPAVADSVAIALTIAPHAAVTRQATAPVQDLVRVSGCREYGRGVWFG